MFRVKLVWCKYNTCGISDVVCLCEIFWHNVVGEMRLPESRKQKIILEILKERISFKKNSSDLFNFSIIIK